MDTAVLGARLALAAVFALAGAAKLVDLKGSRAALVGFGVPKALATPGGLLLPLVELAIAATLVPTDTARWAAAGALVLLLAFIGAISNAMARGRSPDCHCFGQVHSAPAGWSTLARNAVLAALAGFIVVEGPGAALGTWVSDRGSAELAAVGIGIAAVILAITTLNLWVENRRLSHQIENRPLGIAPTALEIGTPAPEFSLSGVRGETLTLAALRGRGKQVVLVFTDPGCGPCRTLLPELGRWQTTLAGDLTIAVISRGTSQENLPASEEHGIADMLLQKDSEVSTAYHIAGTPSAIAISEDGKIASSPAAGAPTIEAMVRLSLQRSGEDAGQVPGEVAT